ncbi:MAG: MFS transporter [Nitrospira sp.]|nr:MFS transporter [Nitrospira sp.]MBX7038764.1 MFS transporter [Nitrospira sp.]HMU30055.1 MFS transporter [Nitrospira sp.]HMV56841.1 MFS transporter [Nitrospira sp.]HMW86314.1 MFS transporter [Nitrospira sp.]
MSHSSIRSYLTPRLGIMLPLGFASGLPLALTGGTLQAWLTEAGLDLTTIGLFAYVGLPYTLKFLWAPVMDRIVPPWLGRRRGWMLVTQSGLALALTVMALIGPAEGAQVFAALALAVAFLSASQDIVFDAYRTDLLKPEERGLGAATWVMGYRIAMIASGSLALILAARLNWSAAYLCMSALMALGIVTILLSPEPEDAQVAPKSMAEAVWGPLSEFLSRPMALALLGLIVLYKLGDAFAGALTTSFLLRGMQFSSEDIGVVRAFGMGATILGAFIGGGLMPRLGLFRSLFVFGVLQALSNLSFMWLAWAGKSYAVMAFAVGAENLTGGMGTAAFVALVMSLCNHRYTATQFALLSSVEALGRVFLGWPAAKLVGLAGWGPFFFVTFLAALPGLWLLWVLRKPVAQHAELNAGRSAAGAPC